MKRVISSNSIISYLVKYLGSNIAFILIKIFTESKKGRTTFIEVHPNILDQAAEPFYITLLLRQKPFKILKACLITFERKTLLLNEEGNNLITPSQQML